MKIRLTEESAVWCAFLPEARDCLSCSRNLYHLWSRNFHVLFLCNKTKQIHKFHKFISS